VAGKIDLKLGEAFQKIGGNSHQPFTD